jgi:tetratricopeptide (TPR) repeat protein
MKGDVDRPLLLHCTVTMSTPLAALALSLGSAVALVAGGIALTTALISRRTAVEERGARRVERAAAAPANGPGVLLPPRLHYFVNRTEAMEEAIARIGDGERVLAIAGGAGVGKSAVAGELVHRLRADDTGVGVPDLSTHDFLWIDGRDGCPTLIDICRQVTLLTGNQSLSSIADSAKLEALRAHFARNKTVLLLDNLRLSEEGSGKPLRELLRTIPSDSLAIASLNSPYVFDGSRILLTDLEPAHIQELIQHEVRRLGLQEDLFDADFAARLQRAVGGNPRLIESFLRALSRTSRTLEQLLEAVERGEGLRELYLPVWSELSVLGRSVLGACACVRGEAIAEQLAVACAASNEQLVTPLEELMQTGLVTVVRDPIRPNIYTCAYSVQRFVLTETSRENVRIFACRLAGHYIRQIAAEPENARWVAPHVNAIKAVMQLLYDHGEYAEVQSLFASVLDVLFTLGLFDDRINTGQLAYESAMRADNPRGASLAVDVIVSTHAARGELEEAREAVGLGLVAAERSGDSGERARMMRANALVLYKDGDAAGALAGLEGAGDLARETGDLEVLGNTCGLRTVAHWHAGEFELSAAAASEALSVCEDMSWHRAMAYPLRNLAEVAIHNGEFAHARKLLADANRISSEHGDLRQLTRVHLTTARLELLGGDPTEAQREAFAARAAALELGLIPELREVNALQAAAARARFFPPLRLYYRARRPARFTDAPVGGD